MEAQQQSPAESRFAGSEAYLEAQRSVSLDDHRQEYEAYLSRLRKFVRLDSDSRMLEIGVGTGWFLVLCKMDGLTCEGLELNPINIGHAEAMHERHGLNATIMSGSIEHFPLEESRYDAIVAMSVFEHVLDYRSGIANACRALKPGGVFYFYSTNKFSLKSGEWNVPLYGWLPYPIRRWLRVSFHGASIVRSAGMDFNQFTYPGLRRAFYELGFRTVLDQYAFLEESTIAVPRAWKKVVLRASRRVRFFAFLTRTFSRGTCFICIK